MQFEKIFNCRFTSPEQAALAEEYLAAMMPLAHGKVRGEKTVLSVEDVRREKERKIRAVARKYSTVTVEILMAEFGMAPCASRKVAKMAVEMGVFSEPTPNGRCGAYTWRVLS